MLEKEQQVLILFKEIQNGNKAAFDELFKRYHDQLLAFAKQYTKQQESAEEITSELFVKLWLKRADLSKVLKPEVYLFAAIKNACLNLIRSEKKRFLLFTDWPNELSINEPAAKNVSGMDDKELFKLIDHAVAALPLQRRMIFNLVKDQGLKSKAVAEILGISVRTVESQLYKAVKTLADSLSGYLGYHPQTKRSKKQLISRMLVLFFIT